MDFDHRTNPAMSRAFDSSRAERPGSPARQVKNGTARETYSNRRSSFDISNAKEFKLPELAMLSITPIIRSIHHWWLHRAERHYLICADVEQQRAREAQMNVAYYQKRAALARSARN